MPGEAMHQLGEEGARRAKRWLEATTRVKASWVNTDPLMAERLTFKWPHSQNPFSFDIGGILHGGEFEGRMFLVECKNYTEARDQGTSYRSYLAKCYLARRDHYRIADEFMWMTWHPFSVTDWSKLCSPQYVKAAVLSERERAFGTKDEDEALQHIDDALIEDVSNRLWVIVLSEKQERLVITKKNRAAILQRELLEEEG